MDATSRRQGQAILPLPDPPDVELAIDDTAGEAQFSSADEDNIGDGSRKRKRVAEPTTVSCELCKQRKVKCDRAKPSCAWCVKNEQVCEYRERKKPGLRAGYGRELEGRLDMVESELQSQRDLLQQITQHIRLPEPLSVPAFVPDAVQSAMPQNHYGYSDVVRPLGEQIETVEALAQHQHMANLGSPAIAFSRQDDDRSTRLAVPAPVSAIPNTDYDQNLDLPPYDFLHALLKLYFERVNTWAPILHEQATFDCLLGSTNLSDEDCIVLHGIIATTIKFSDDSRLDHRLREQYYARSKQKVILYGMEHSSIKALQALVLLSFDVVGTTNGPPAWNLLALITRAAVQLGISSENKSTSMSSANTSIYTLRAAILPEPKDFIEAESRRRLFWAIYALDRFATVTTAFDFALNDDDIRCRLPCHDDHFHQNRTVSTAPHRDSLKGIPRDGIVKHGNFSFYIEVLDMLSRVHDFLKQPIDIKRPKEVARWQKTYRHLNDMLDKYQYTLPREVLTTHLQRWGLLLYDKDVDPMLLMLRAIYHTTVIRLHSSAAYPTVRSATFKPSYTASQKCVEAAEQLRLLCNASRVKMEIFSKLGPPFAFALWVAARVLLVHGSTIGPDYHFDDLISDLVQGLHELGVHYKVAERYATLLDRVLSEKREANADTGGDQSSGKEGTATMKILADMRRTAYDLDVLISRQPRASSVTGQQPLSAIMAQTPGSTELEYLDVFEFFNMPRLPFPAGDGLTPGSSNASGMLQGSNEFNITDFVYDANKDWFGNS